MALSRKPRSASETEAPVVDVDALILKGGSVAAGGNGLENSQNDSSVKGKGPTPVVLRIPAPLLERIDSALGERSVRIPRHTWLLEALVEKLEREQS